MQLKLVLGVIDRIGRPKPRSRPKSGRDRVFSRVVAGARVATRIFLWVATRGGGRDPKFFRVTIPNRSRPPTLVKIQVFRMKHTQTFMS